MQDKLKNMKRVDEMNEENTEDSTPNTLISRGTFCFLGID